MEVSATGCAAADRLPWQQVSWFTKLSAANPGPHPYTPIHTHLWDKFGTNLSNRRPCKVAPACRWETQAANTLESQAGTDLHPVADSHVSHSTKRTLPAGLWDPSVNRSGRQLKNEVHSTEDWFSHKWGDSMETGRWTANSTPKWGFEEFLFFPLVPRGEKKRRSRATAPNSALHVPASSAAHLLS